jgi:hypothetical protein
MLKRSRRITDVANSMLGLRWCIGEQDTSDPDPALAWPG